MRLGLLTGYFGPDIRIDYDLILEAERLGYDSVWTSEAYGCDAIVPLAFIAAKTTRLDSVRRSCRCPRELLRWLR